MLEKLAADIILIWGWKRNGLAFLAGLLLNIALPPINFLGVGFISFPILLWLLEGADGNANARGMLRHYPAAIIGWFFGFGYFLGGLWWLGNAVIAESNEFLWALPLAVFGLPAGLAFFFAFAAILARMVWGHGIGTAAALAFGIGISEWARSVLFTGFPWNGIGLTMMPTPIFMQSASVFGVTGMNALAVFVFALPASFASSPRKWLGPAIAITLLVAHGAFGFSRLNQKLTETSLPDAKIVRLVQPSIPQFSKWDEAERDRIFATYLEMTAAAPEADKPEPSLIIWPETAVPFIFADRPDALAAIGEVLTEGQTLLAGTVRQEGTRENGDQIRYYNSMVAIDADGQIIDAADKVHLVPFGEYLPMQNLLRSFGLDEIVNTPGGFSAGPRLHAFKLPNLPHILPMICYEIIFPGAIEAANVRPELVVNITNDAWYGHTPGPYQHFRLAQLRAVESGVPVVRSANNGVSGVIDSLGRIQSALDLDVVGNLDAVLIKESAQTYYSAFGLRIVFLTYCALIAIAGLTNFKQRSRIVRSV